MMPFTIAFNMKWKFTDKLDGFALIYGFTDVMFLVDIVSIFFTSIPETEERDEITHRKTIATRYLRGWFAVDVTAILPIDWFISYFENKMGGSKGANVLFRAPRVQKAFKVVRMLRLVKLIKLAKNK